MWQVVDFDLTFCYVLISVKFMSEQNYYLQKAALACLSSTVSYYLKKKALSGLLWFKFNFLEHAGELCIIILRREQNTG